MTSDNATTPAATPAVQEPRVNDAEMRISARIAEQQPVQNYSVVDRFALDLRDARATIASQAEALAAMKAENERVVANMVAAQHAQATAEAALKAAREALEAAKEWADRTAPIAPSTMRGKSLSTPADPSRDG